MGGSGVAQFGVPRNRHVQALHKETARADAATYLPVIISQKGGMETLVCPIFGIGRHTLGTLRWVLYDGITLYIQSKISLDIKASNIRCFDV
jgi:hypothetical protein